MWKWVLRTKKSERILIMARKIGVRRYEQWNWAFTGKKVNIKSVYEVTQIY
jgi:hypothetical protein